MYRYIALIVLSLSFISEASAATWNSFKNAFSNTALFFFDSETVVKQGDGVTLWVKYVNDKTSPDSDGSYATAQKVTYLCSKRTSQVFTTVIYDRDENFIKTYPKPDPVKDIIPGSVGEGILKAVCTPDFPKNKSGDLYFPVEGNDIFKHSAKYFDFQRERNTDPAPK